MENKDNVEFQKAFKEYIDFVKKLSLIEKNKRQLIL